MITFLERLSKKLGWVGRFIRDLPVEHNTLSHGLSFTLHLVTLVYACTATMAVNVIVLVFIGSNGKISHRRVLNTRRATAERRLYVATDHKHVQKFGNN